MPAQRSRPPRPGRSSRGRPLKLAFHAPDHINPVRDLVLAGGEPELPQYLTLPSPSVLPVLAVRSCHLPHDHTAAAVQHYAADHCAFCGECVLEEVGSGAYTEEERRWRHAQHMLCACPDALYATRPEGFFRYAPTLSALRRDLTAALPAPQAAAVRDAFQCEVACPTVAREQLMPLFLDPVRFIGAEVPPPGAFSVVSLCRRVRCACGSQACPRRPGPVPSGVPSSAAGLPDGPGHTPRRCRARL